MIQYDVLRGLQCATKAGPKSRKGRACPVVLGGGGGSFKRNEKDSNIKDSLQLEGSYGPWAWGFQDSRIPENQCNERLSGILATICIYLLANLLGHTLAVLESFLEV